VGLLNGLLLRIAHWFGARRFHFDEDSWVIADVSAPTEAVLSAATRNLMGQSFKLRGTRPASSSSSAFGSDRGTIATHSERSEFRGPVEMSPKLAQKTEFGSAKPDLTAEARDFDEDRCAGLSRDACGATPCKASFPGSLEQFRWQYAPVFIMLQISVVLGLWLALTFWNGRPFALDKERADAESFWPGKTSLEIHRDCDDLRHELWRWLTYQFNHDGLYHVLSNVGLAVIAGIPLEGFHGHLRIVAVFNFGVLGGACCHVLFNAHDHPLQGMSSGCYALMAMHVANLLINWKESRYRISQLLVLVLLMIPDVLHWYLSEEEDSKNMFAHIGGYVGGFLVGVIMGRTVKASRRQLALQAMACLAGAALITFSVAWIFFSWPPKTLWDPLPWCWARQVNNRTLFGDSAWHCVRCSSQACIDHWSQQQSVTWVAARVCEASQGWMASEG